MAVGDFFAPLNAQEFDLAKCAHLLRRAGFGCSPDEISLALEQGLEATVDQLLEESQEQEDEFESVYRSVAGTLMNFADPGQAQAWWVHRMIKTRTPLLEKLTLFWHGHFATSFQKVEDLHLMEVQCNTLRRMALGNFRDLVLAVARDPAMLVYLDGQSNTQAHPNENFARELMELFTCGIGHYTEHDVQESARAFTGWHRENDQFVFHPDDHDGGRKEFLGKAGNFDGDDIVEILMQHPATPRFVGGKLLRFFATATPSDAARDAAGSLLDRTQLNVRWFLRELFLSAWFYSDECYRQRISSPAEFVVGTVRSLSVRMQASELASAMSAMGQELYAPPNVKGWDGEQKWINSSSWPARVAFAETVSGLSSDSEFGAHLPMDQLVSTDVTEPREVIDALSNVVMQGDVTDEVRGKLADFLVATDDGPNLDQFRDDPGFRGDKSRQALSAMLSLPEYHAC